MRSPRPAAPITAVAAPSWLPVAAGAAGERAEPACPVIQPEAVSNADRPEADAVPLAAPALAGAGEAQSAGPERIGQRRPPHVAARPESVLSTGRHLAERNE